MSDLETQFFAAAIVAGRYALAVTTWLSSYA